MKHHSFALQGKNVHVSCVKQAESGDGLIIRLFNALDTEQSIQLKFGKKFEQAFLCNADESIIDGLIKASDELKLHIQPKKIITVKVIPVTEGKV